VKGSLPAAREHGHKGHARNLAEKPDVVEDHRPTHCLHCGLPFAEDEAGAVIGEYDEIDLPEVKPIVKRHRRLKCRCATCGKKTAAPLPQAGRMARPLACASTRWRFTSESNQLFSYERLQGAFADLFGLTLQSGAR